jgi:hypothetical protein
MLLHWSTIVLFFSSDSFHKWDGQQNAMYLKSISGMACHYNKITYSDYDSYPLAPRRAVTLAYNGAYVHLELAWREFVLLFPQACGHGLHAEEEQEQGASHAPHARLLCLLLMLRRHNDLLGRERL